MGELRTGAAARAGSARAARLSRRPCGDGRHAPGRRCLLRSSSRDGQGAVRATKPARAAPDAAATLPDHRGHFRDCRRTDDGDRDEPMIPKATDIAAPEGKLGILLVGLGAVSTTLVAGVEAVKRGLARPIGSLTQMGTIRLGRRTERRVPPIKDFVPLAGLDRLVFGAWDIFPEDAYEVARAARVLDERLLEAVKPTLRKLRPWPAVFAPDYVKRLHGTHVKQARSKRELAEQL